MTIKAGKLESIIRSEVAREMKRRRFTDEEEMEDDDEELSDDDEELNDDYDDVEDDSDDVEDDDEEVEDDDDDKEDAKDAFTDSVRFVLRQAIDKEVKRKMKTRDSWGKLSKDMKSGNRTKNVMDKRDEDRCNAWKKTISKEA